MLIEDLYKKMNAALEDGNDLEAARLYCQIEFLESQLEEAAA